MARPHKKGLDYYSCDTDRYQDNKIKRLKHSFGVSGLAVYDYILCEIYRDKGCFIEWDESTAFNVSDYLGLKESLVNEIVNYCCAVCLFSKELLASEKVLTSFSIQERYAAICKSASRKNWLIPELIKLSDKETKLTTKETQVNKPESTQSKAKESKGNETIPVWPDFLAYSIFHKANVCEEALKLKYESWIVDDWSVTRDGRKVKIQNWKKTILNTLPHLKLKDTNKQVTPHNPYANIKR